MAASSSPTRSADDDSVKTELQSGVKTDYYTKDEVDITDMQSGLQTDSFPKEMKAKTQRIRSRSRSRSRAVNSSSEGRAERDKRFKGTVSKARGAPPAFEQRWCMASPERDELPIGARPGAVREELPIGARPGTRSR